MNYKSCSDCQVGTAEKKMFLILSQKKCIYFSFILSFETNLKWSILSPEGVWGSL